MVGPFIERLRSSIGLSKETKRGSHELTKEYYLSTLSDIDRKNVENFIDFTQSLQSKIGGINVALSAFGSTTKPENMRYHEPDDIDLRIHNACHTNHGSRDITVKKIVSLVEDYLNERKLSYTYKDHTISEIVVPATVGFNEKTIMAGYIDYNNNDPSFEVECPSGTPLHISISGVDALAKDDHLNLERTRNTYFSLLYESTPLSIY